MIKMRASVIIIIHVVVTFSTVNHASASRVPAKSDPTKPLLLNPF